MGLTRLNWTYLNGQSNGPSPNGYKNNPYRTYWTHC